MCQHFTIKFVAICGMLRSYNTYEVMHLLSSNLDLTMKTLEMRWHVYMNVPLLYNPALYIQTIDDVIV